MALTKVSSKTLSDNAVTSDKIAAGAISVSDIADNSITATKLHTSVQGALGTRNLIINGDMRIAQRWTSINMGGSSVAYCVDRWAHRGNSGSNPYVAQVTDVPSNQGFEYALYFGRQVGATGGGLRNQQAFETRNIVHLRGKQVTLSFWAKKDTNYSAADDLLRATIYTGNGTERIRMITAYDNASDLTDNVTLTSSWQKFTITYDALPLDLSQMTLEFYYTPVGTALSNDGYFITGVQLEVGDTATPFEHRPYDMELARCQRYYYKLANDSGAATACLFGNGSIQTSTQLAGSIKFPTQMRIPPTSMETTGTASDYRIWYAGNAALDCTSLPLLSGVTSWGCRIYFTGSGGLTGGQAGHFRSSTTNAYLAWNAEL